MYKMIKFAKKSWEKCVNTINQLRKKTNYMYRK